MSHLEWRMLLAPSRRSLWMLLNTQQWTGQPPAKKMIQPQPSAVQILRNPAPDEGLHYGAWALQAGCISCTSGYPWAPPWYLAHGEGCAVILKHVINEWVCLCFPQSWKAKLSFVSMTASLSRLAALPKVTFFPHIYLEFAFSFLSGEAKECRACIFEEYWYVDPRYLFPKAYCLRIAVAPFLHPQIVLLHNGTVTIGGCGSLSKRSLGPLPFTQLPCLSNLRKEQNNSNMVNKSNFSTNLI